MLYLFQRKIIITFSNANLNVMKTVHIVFMYIKRLFSFIKDAIMNIFTRLYFIVDFYIFLKLTIIKSKIV